MEMSILPKFLTLKWNISRTIWRIEVGDGSLFCIFHALSFELNFFFDRRFPLIAYIIRKMDKKFKRIYYSDDGYWRGKSAIQKLSKASGSTKEEAEMWLMKQSLYQIYLPAPKYVPMPNASMSIFAKPNDIHQADILYLPHDRYERKVYKYALIIVDVASRYK